MILKAILTFIILITISTPGFTEGLSIQVSIKQFKSDNGQVMARLFNRADAFPTKAEKALAARKAQISNRQAELSFDGLPPGEYAIAVYHDENGNNELDTNWIGIPAEGLGASNNAKGSFGPPKFTDAKIQLTQSTHITINIKY